ncbi:MAG: diaminopimelate decarboxylase [Candidatus Melainabacteria bacterium]|nr:diaminopimelate decarboxylase [Candidatus Melainabacteria bacterium]
MQELNQIKPLSLERNATNELVLAGIKVSELAQHYGTPAYLLCEQTIRARAQAYRQAFEQEYPNHLVVYASKALNCLAMCKLIEQEGLGLDVVSEGELHTAIEASFPCERIIFHGNNKSRDEVKLALTNGVTLVLDNRTELAYIEELLKSDPELKAQVLIRITPGIECHTHDYIKTGKIDSKFGFNLEELDEIIERIKATDIHIRGLHAHIGSQIFETIPHKDTCKVLLELYKSIKEKHGLEFEDLNVGGGLGIMYTESDDPPEIFDWVKIITDAVKANCEELEVKQPRIMVEPGRSIVGPAGITVYKVGNIKDIPGVRKYVAVDGGMADNARPIMYQAEYTAEVDAKDPTTNLEKVTIAGKYCESGDVLIPEIELPQVEAGNLIVVYSTGAYNYSMASNYNRATKPSLVLVNKGQSHIIVQAETVDDLLRNDKLAPHLR